MRGNNSGFICRDAYQDEGHQMPIILPPPFTPFLARGGIGCEDMIEGWYFRDDRNVLSGPYTSELDAEQFIEEAKYVEPR